MEIKNTKLNRIIDISLQLLLFGFGYFLLLIAPFIGEYKEILISTIIFFTGYLVRKKFGRTYKFSVEAALFGINFSSTFIMLDQISYFFYHTQGTSYTYEAYLATVVLCILIFLAIGKISMLIKSKLISKIISAIPFLLVGVLFYSTEPLAEILTTFPLLTSLLVGSPMIYGYLFTFGRIKPEIWINFDTFFPNQNEPLAEK